jgi:hypothetical protein
MAQDGKQPAVGPFKQAIDVLIREQRAFDDDRAQWEFERVELLNKYVCFLFDKCPASPLIYAVQSLDQDFRTRARTQFSRACQN